MPSVPTWREPIFKKAGHKNANWALELHRPSFDDPRIPKCHAIAPSTGEKCRNISVRGSCYCRRHGGIRLLEKRIAEGKSSRVYGPNNPRFGTQINVGAHTTKANLAGHIYTQKELTKLRKLYSTCDGHFIKDLPVSVQSCIATLTWRKRLTLFNAWLNKKIDPRAWTKALKELNLG